MARAGRDDGAVISTRAQRVVEGIAVVTVAIATLVIVGVIAWDLLLRW